MEDIEISSLEYPTEYLIIHPISAKRIRPMKGFNDEVLLDVGCKIAVISVGASLARIKCTYYEKVPRCKKKLDRVEGELFTVDVLLLKEAINSEFKVKLVIRSTAVGN